MRTYIDLNQNWLFALVPGFVQVEKNEVEKLKFTEVNLPHDWMISAPFNRHMEEGLPQGFRERWGMGWYQKNLTLSKKEKAQYYLCFDGVYENSTIWINDICVGGRKYGYSSFKVDVTEALTEGDNHILVKVDNTATPTDRWYAGAGIYRKVYLEILPMQHLYPEEIQVITKVENAKASLEIRTGMEQLIQATLISPRGEAVCTASGSESIIMEVTEPVLWSAEVPELYTLSLQLLGEHGAEEIVDEITVKIGLRKVELFADKGLFVNGESVKLKGVCVHQEAGCFGTAVQKEVWKERLLKLKEIGCNAIRLAHHLYMPEMLELCDELGFYVYEEAFDKWTGGSYGRYYETEWEKDLTCMVKRDRNHSCILFWGVGNEVENQAQDSMLELLEKHVAKVKELDATRPVSVAMNPHFGYPAPPVDMSQIKDIQQFVDEMKTGEIFDMDDRVERIKLIAEKVDLVCCNYQEQWYERIHKAIPDKAILGTETYMYFRGYEECFQNFMDRNPWWDVEENDYCIGGMLWTGIDYLGESMAYPAKGWSGALFATDMEKRPIAWQFQSYWTKEPMIHFAVMDYSLPDTGAKEHWDYPRYESHWEFPQFNKVVIPYMIATNCEQVEIYVNEKTYLLQPTDSYPNRVITGFLPYLPGKVTVIGKNAGVEVCRKEVKTPGMAVQLKFEQEEQYVRLEDMRGVAGRKSPYQKLLKVRAYDADGNPVFREAAKVQFIVEGAAEIVGVDNGDIKGAEPLDNDTIHLFQGRADVAIRITDIGRVRVTAIAAGMRMAQTIIVAE